MLVISSRIASERLLAVAVGAKVKAVIALWLISLKFMQLFTLTYDSAAIDSLVSPLAYICIRTSIPALD